MKRTRVTMNLDASGDAAARILFTRVGFTAHDALSNFHDEANKWVHPKTSDNCGNDNSRNRTATGVRLLEFCWVQVFRCPKLTYTHNQLGRPTYRDHWRWSSK